MKLSCCAPSCLSVEKDSDVWYADSGATQHMCSQEHWFKNFQSYPEKLYMVRVGDGSEIDVRGKGDVDVQIKEDNGSVITYTIKDVLYVPKLQKNLLSISETTKKGISVIFKEGGNTVSFERKGKQIIVGTKDRNLYRLKMISVAVMQANIATCNSIMAWHERLGHVNFKTLRKMQQLNAVEGLTIKDIPNKDPLCEGCILGKQHRTEFPRNNTKRAQTPGELFHADLCGMMSTQSLGGSSYFLLLKDDCSRYCFIYFLKKKTEVLEKLKECYSEVQAQGHLIRRLRTDGGREFCNAEIRNFLLSKSIKHEVTTPRAPEQNGFIERQNRTVVESAKAMLHTRKLPQYLWAEAANTAVYVKNRTATDTTGGVTPFEKWYGKRPSVSHLKIFGSDCYVHIPKEQRTK